MKEFLLLLSIPISSAALLYARWEYRKRGRLTGWGLALLCVMLFIPNLILEYATGYELPKTLIDFFGVLIGSFGLALCLVSVIFFRSAQKILCLDCGELTTIGPYRWSRNPQYVGWFLFLLGFALNDWSAWCLIALLVSSVSLHLLVLVEEEHLLRVFGDRYAAFRRNVPRYAGRGNK